MLTTAGIFVTVLTVFVMISVIGSRREIDQKVLIICRLQQPYYADAGYFIDNQGREMKFDFTGAENTISDEELLERLSKRMMREPTEERKEYIEELFSEKEIVKLYDWLYKIDSSCEIERTQVYQVKDVYRILGVRYKEDGTPEIITIFEGGKYDGNNPDRYAQKIRKAVLGKKPVKIRAGIYYTK